MSPAFRVAIPFAALLLCGCAAGGTQQVRTSAQCESFAHSGGYPFLTGGTTYGPNSGIEQLPGMPPLIFGPFDPEIVRHLDEEDYLRRWCMQTM